MLDYSVMRIQNWLYTMVQCLGNVYAIRVWQGAQPFYVFLNLSFSLFCVVLKDWIV